MQVPKTHLGSQYLFGIDVEDLKNLAIAKRLSFPESLLKEIYPPPSPLHLQHPLFENLRRLIHQIDQEAVRNPEKKAPLDRIKNLYETYIYQACLSKLSPNCPVSLFHTAENSIEMRNYARDSLPILKTFYINYPRHPEIIRCLNKIAEASVVNGDPEEAKEFAIEACRLNLERLKGSRLLNEVACSCAILGLAFLRTNNPQTALDYYNFADHFCRQAYAAPHPLLACSLKNLAQAHNALNQEQETLRKTKEADAMIETLYGSDSPELGVSIAKTAVFYWNYKYEETAKQSLSKAFHIFENQPIDQLQPNDAIALNDMGNLYRDLDEPDKALKCFQMSLGILNRCFPTQPHPKVASLLKKIGSIFMEREEHDLALQCFSLELEMEKKLYSDVNHPKIASAYQRIGSLHLALKNFENARLNLELAFALLSKSHPNGHPDHLVILSDLGRIYSAIGKAFKAQEDYEKAQPFFKMAIQNHTQVWEIACKLNPTHDLTVHLSKLLIEAKTELELLPLNEYTKM